MTALYHRRGNGMPSLLRLRVYMPRWRAFRYWGVLLRVFRYYDSAVGRNYEDNYNRYLVSNQQYLLPLLIRGLRIPDFSSLVTAYSLIRSFVAQAPENVHVTRAHPGPRFPDESRLRHSLQRAQRPP